MAYITESNMLKIIRQTDINQINIKGNVYKMPIFFLSKFEEKSLLAIKELISRVENFADSIYKPLKVSDNYKYIFEVTKPAFHNDIKCSRLLTNFSNYEVPSEIMERGVDEVIRYRKWFLSNFELVEKPDVFLMRMQNAFGISVNPKCVSYKNSGPANIENLSLNEVENLIDDIIREAGKFYHQSDKNKIIISNFSKKTYLAYRLENLPENNTNYSDDEIKAFLKFYDEQFKYPLKRLLIKYYRIKLNPELNMDEKILIQLGFAQCLECQRSSKHQQSHYAVEEDMPFISPSKLIKSIIENKEEISFKELNIADYLANFDIDLPF